MARVAELKAEARQLASFFQALGTRLGEMGKSPDAEEWPPHVVELLSEAERACQEGGASIRWLHVAPVTIAASHLSQPKICIEMAAAVVELVVAVSRWHAVWAAKASLQFARAATVPDRKR